MKNKLKPRHKFLIKHQIKSYVIFGILTTLINYIVYIIAVKLFNIYYVIGNIIAWVVAVLFAFVTNKFYVFRSKKKNFEIIFNEFYKFTIARILTGLMETGLLWVLVDFLKQSDLIMKIITNIFVIISNFILNKFLVFKKQKGSFDVNK